MKKLSILPPKRQRAKTEPSDFSEMKQADFALPQETSQSLGTYHLSCKTLPLNSFIKAYCNNDYSGLVKSGTPSDEGLKAAWNEILFDYSGLIKSEDSDYIFQLAKRIGLLQFHIMYVDYAVLFLETTKDDDIAGELRDMGYNIPPFEDNTFSKSLQMVKSLAKAKVFELDTLTDEYNRISQTKGGKQQTEDEYIRTVVMLSKYQGYNLDRNTTTVYDFAQIFNNYLSEMKIKNKENG